MNKSLIAIVALFLIISCKTPEARRPVSQKTGSTIEASIMRNKELNLAEETNIKKIIEQNPDREYFSSENGFWYFYNKQDSTTVKPKIGDLVNFDYDIKSLNGEPILSKSELGTQTYQIDQSNQELISGLRQGLKLMREGETVTFLFPSHKAFGYYGFEDKIGSNRPIQATVTLNQIKTNNPEN
ncbi:MAG: gliding motility-associated peptidyl-prolyl isomerase GldI [Leeuwenhoekiella sp.]